MGKVITALILTGVAIMFISVMIQAVLWLIPIILAILLYFIIYGMVKLYCIFSGP